MLIVAEWLATSMLLLLSVVTLCDRVYRIWDLPALLRRRSSDDER